MRNIRDVLRLHEAEHLSSRAVGIAVGLPRTTVRNYIDRARKVGLHWPLPDDLDDRDLEERLFGRAAPPPAILRRPEPDWAAIHAEMRRPHVTLMLLWSEYRERCHDGFAYSWFAERYRAFADHLPVVLRGNHRAGEKLFLDFAGDKIKIVDPDTGLISEAELFVAVLGASNYTYAEAVPSQSLPDWTAAHVRAFEFFGGVAALLIPDNLRSAVTKADRYEADLNRTYEELATHYGTAIMPARSRKPRDKAKVEQGVLLVERWILAALRNRVFFSLADANAAIAERLEWLNNRPFRKLEGCRASVFAEVDRPALRPLPERPFEWGIWKRVKVNIDYHVELDCHYYSVPYQLAHEICDARLSATTVELFVRGRRVASHLRSYERYRATTDPAHMPASHRAYLEWTPSRLINWGQQAGPSTGRLLDEILASKPHPELGYRSALGVMRLGRRYGSERLEAACTRALAITSPSYRSVDSILKNGLDRAALPSPAPARPSRRHANVRGPGYYE
jgi:transposase